MKSYEIEIKLKEVQAILNQINRTQSGTLNLCANVVNYRRMSDQFTSPIIYQLADTILYTNPTGITIPFKVKNGTDFSPRAHTFIEKIQIIFKVACAYWKYL
jgi:hypothetical protein